MQGFAPWVGKRSERYIVKSAFLTEQSFAQIIVTNGGRAFRVGGCVRDMIMGIEPKDIDLCVVSMVKRNFKTLFPHAEEYGKAFPVFRLVIDGVKREVAFARTERKVGSGHKGFKVSFNPKVTIEEDLYRRDTTVNSMAVDCLTGEIIDPFNGCRDIRDRILRATSRHFSDDPVRALRLAGQSARLRFRIEGETLRLASAVAEELGREPAERILAELAKVLAEAQEPAGFFQVLAEAGLLSITFTEIANLSAEDFATAMARLDAVAKDTQNAKLRFAALGSVLDKESLDLWNHRMTLPGDWLDSAVAVGKTLALLGYSDPEKIVTAINSLSRGVLSIEEFDGVVKAAGLKLAALGPLKSAMTLSAEDIIPQTLKGKDIGKWLRHKHAQIIAELIK